MKADDAILRYLRERDDVLPGLRAVGQGEVAHVPREGTCPKKGCKSRRYRWHLSPKGDRWVCASPICGADWPVRVINVATARGHGESVLERHASELRVLERPLSELPLWPRRTLLAYAHVTRLRHLAHNIHRDPRRFSTAAVVREYQEAAARAGERWERRIPALAARMLAEAPKARTVAVVAECFARLFASAPGAPKSERGVRDALRRARQGYESASSRLYPMRAA